MTGVMIQAVMVLQGWNVTVFKYNLETVLFLCFISLHKTLLTKQNTDAHVADVCVHVCVCSYRWSSSLTG